MKILVTGGRGFIGSNVVQFLVQNGHQVVILDAGTYAARKTLLDKDEMKNVTDLTVDIRNRCAVREALERTMPDHIMHLAAESHVCRSIAGPEDFITTNVYGTWVMLEEWRRLWSCTSTHRFVHISTDEVFGSLSFEDRPFDEDSPYDPTSPYSASKAGADMIALAYARTYRLPVVITNCSNNFGPNQHPEKLIPKAIHSIVSKGKMTVYGNGSQVRDWIHVDDHARGLVCALQGGAPGERYLFGGDWEMTNLETIRTVQEILTETLSREVACEIVHTDDRPTDDIRYAIDNTRVRNMLGHKTLSSNYDGMRETIRWYLRNFEQQFGEAPPWAR